MAKILELETPKSWFIVSPLKDAIAHACWTSHGWSVVYDIDDAEELYTTRFSAVCALEHLRATGDIFKYGIDENPKVVDRDTMIQIVFDNEMERRQEERAAEVYAENLDV